MPSARAAQGGYEPLTGFILVAVTIASAEVFVLAAAGLNVAETNPLVWEL
jgi:hypothetical protein